MPFPSQLTGLLLLASAAFAQTTETIQIVAVTNAADFRIELPMNGSLASVFCTGLQGEPGIVYASEYPISNELRGVSVTINSLPAPILAIGFLDGYQQLNIQVPWNLRGDPYYDHIVITQGEQQAQLEVLRSGTFTPSVFFADAKGFGIVRHASNNTLVTTDNPARPGEDLIAYGINLGTVRNAPATGSPAPFEPPFAPLNTSLYCAFSQQMKIGNATAQLSYNGLAPGTVGVYQMNFTLPAIGDAGDLPMSIEMTITYGSVPSCFPSGIYTFMYRSRSVLIPIR